MYSDIYYKLTTEERKVLETYHKKLKQSQTKLNSSKEPKQETRQLHPSSSSRSLSKNSKNPDSKAIKNPSFLTPSSKTTYSPFKKVTPKPYSSIKTFKNPKKSIETEDFNLKYEIEKLLRSLYRHSVICPEFKSEISKIGGISLLDEYLKYRALNN